MHPHAVALRPLRMVRQRLCDRAGRLLEERKTAALEIAEEWLTSEVRTGGQVTRIISGLPGGAPVEAAPVASDQPTSSETERPPVVPSIGKPLPQE